MHLPGTFRFFGLTIEPFEDRIVNVCTANTLEGIYLQSNCIREFGTPRKQSRDDWLHLVCWENIVT